WSDSVSERDVHGALAGRYKNSTAPRLSLPASSGMNKILNNDNSKPPRRIDTAGYRSSLKDGPTINKEEAKRNRKERRDGLSRRVLSTLCPGWTALATVCPGHATALFRGLSPSHRPRSPRSVPRSGRAAQEVRQERRLRLLRGNRLSVSEPTSQIIAQLLVRSWDNGWDNRRGSTRDRIALKRRQRNDLVGFE